MPEMHDEGREGAGAAASTEARRVDQDPDKVRIELRGGGWPEAVARVRSSWWSGGQYQTPSGIRFWWVKTDALILHHAPTVLVLQGMLLQDLFMPDMYFLDVNTNITLVRGPWVFLKGRLTERWETPMRIDEVTLAALEHVPEGLTKEQVLAELLAAVT